MTTYQGSCHYGSVKFEVEAELDHVRVCDCSICARRGALIHRVPMETLRLLTPWEELKTYLWGSRTACDYFCPKCGILLFRRPSDPSTEELAQGARSFDGRSIELSGIETDGNSRR